MAHVKMKSAFSLQLKLAALASLLMPASAFAVDFAAAREQQFMQACMTDATVAAGQREALCLCIFEAFAYGGETRFGITDVLALDDRVWEAPDRRLPRDALGEGVRQIRQACVREVNTAR